MGGIIVKTAVCSFCHRPVQQTEWLVSSPYDESVTICRNCAAEAISVVERASDDARDKGKGE